jgi:hypothetical protein
VVTILRPPARPLPDPLHEHVWSWDPADWFTRIFHLHPHRAPLRARTWGPINRFDPHIRDRHQRPREQSDGRGVIYVARDLACGLAEAFPERAPEVPVCPNQFAILAAPRVPVTLLDLTGDGAMQIGAVATLGSGNEPRRLTQRWGRAIYEDIESAHGILYRGAHQGGTAIAVWDRASDLISESGSRAPGYRLTRELFDRVTTALARQGRYPTEIAPSECRTCREAGLV